MVVLSEQVAGSAGAHAYRGPATRLPPAWSSIGLRLLPVQTALLDLGRVRVADTAIRRDRTEIGRRPELRPLLLEDVLHVAVEIVQARSFSGRSSDPGDHWRPASS